MLIKGGWCKRKRAEIVEMLELSHLRKKDTTSPFSNNNYNFIMNTPVGRVQDDKYGRYELRSYS